MVSKGMGFDGENEIIDDFCLEENLNKLFLFDRIRNLHLCCSLSFLSV